MAKNEFLPFGTAEGANVLAAPEYENLTARHNGFTSGVAKSKELNKVWRQASVMASVLAQFIVDTDKKDLLDDGDVPAVKNRLVFAMKEAFKGEMPAVPKTVQTTGESTKDVMSQKAVTDAIKGIKVPEIKDASTTEKGIVQLDDTISESKTKVPTSKAVSDALKNAASVNLLYPVGIVVFFAQNKNPNTLFPNTKWTYIGENKTIRLANVSGDNVLKGGGSDNVTLQTANLPAHGHGFSGTTSNFDYGTKSTNTTGDHSHGIPTGREFGAGNMPVGDGKNTYTTNTSGAGNHAHSVNIGTHSHKFEGTTSNSGNGEQFSVVNQYIMLMGWYRSE